MNVLLRGAASGLAGVFAMSEVLGLGEQAGVVEGDLAVKDVAERIEERVGVRDDLPEGVFEASWIGSHFTYGTAMGLLYALAERRLKFDKGYRYAVPAGLLFGVAVWVLGFAGWVPLAKLYPSPGDQSPKKLTETLGAHLVYGAATAIGYRMLRRAP